jgi:hypothetical protein
MQLFPHALPFLQILQHPRGAASMVQASAGGADVGAKAKKAAAMTAVMVFLSIDPPLRG